MKKAKIMLLAVAVFATVGTALAFKVKVGGTKTYCWVQASAIPDPQDCTNERQFAIPLDYVSGTPIYYTEKGTGTCGELECELTAQGFAD